MQTNTTYMIEVTAGVIQKFGKFLIARRAEGRRMAGYWEFPGGKVEPGESFEACLTRELKEELNLDVQVEGHICDSVYDEADRQIVLKAFNGTVDNIDGLILHDHDEVKWISIYEFGDYEFAPADLPIVKAVLERRARLLEKHSNADSMTTNATNNEPILQTALYTVHSIDANLEVKSKLEELLRKVATLESLIHNYTHIQKDGVSSDDEVINWTMPVVKDELNAAVWNLASGFYKTAATCLKGALEMGHAALYFQILENGNRNDGEYSQKFADWDCGATATPGWQEMEPVLSEHHNVKEFHSNFPYCPVNEVGLYLQLLERFAHNSAFSSVNGEATNSMSMKSASGQFSEVEFARISSAVDTTISIIASTWITIFPHILHKLESNMKGNVEELFSADPALDAFDFAAKKIEHS